MNDNQKIIIISGANTQNKGSESMLSTSVHVLEKLFPDHRIVIISDFLFYEDIEKRINYRIEILPESLAYFGLNDVFTYYMIKNELSHFADQKMLDRLTHTEYWVDISGYKLGQQWGTPNMLRFLYRIHIAEKFSIRMFLLPQSFGPFKIGFRIKDLLFYYLMKKKLKYPIVIMAREVEAKKSIEKFSKKNILYFPDMVLCHGAETHDQLIYKKIVKNTFSIPMNSVAIVPNEKLYTKGAQLEYVIDIYTEFIIQLKMMNKEIWLIPHCTDDFYLCKMIKNKFQCDDTVVYVDRVLGVLDYRNLIRQFDFAIISRYHGCVHALLEDIPCIFLGWDVKYRSLAESVGLEGYVMDINGSWDAILCRNLVIQMARNKDILKKIIKKKIDNIQKKYNLEKVLLFYMGT